MAEAAIERMREYAEHDAECQGQPGYDIPCSCGYDELMKELDDANWEGSMHTDYSHYWPVNWRPQDERILATMGADVPRIHADVGVSQISLEKSISLSPTEWRCTDEEPEGCAEYRKIYGQDNPRPRRPCQELGQIKERLARAAERDAAALEKTPEETVGHARLREYL